MRHLSVVLVAVLEAACTTPDQAAPPPPPQVVRQQLAAGMNVTLWPDTTPVCFFFTNSPSGGTTDFQAARTAIFNALQETWAAASNIDFVDVGMCGSSIPSDTLAIDLRGGEGAAGACALLGRVAPSLPVAGTSAMAHCWVGTEDLPKTARVAVHEVGHALGFGHEHQRMVGTGWEMPLCVCEQQRLDDANYVIAVNTPIAFSATSCWGPITLTVPVAQVWRANRIAVPMNSLTAFDGLSIMNYCATPLVGSESHALTQADALGAELAYPFPLTHQATPSSALFGVGPVSVGRSDLVVAPSSALRGATAAVFGVDSVAWRVDGQLATWGVDFPAIILANYGAGAHTVTGTFTDVFGNPQQVTGLGPITVVLDDSLHTALMWASLGL